MIPAPTFDRIWVFSDLHLAPAGELLKFHAAGPLVSWLRELADSPERTALVLNGDCFDYLQMPAHDSVRASEAEGRTQALLQGIDSPHPETNVLGALRSVIEAGHEILVVPGNHDAELAFEGARAELQRRLEPGGTSGRLRFHLEDHPWELLAGERIVRGEHGHASDPWNAVSAAEWVRAERSGTASLPLPAGSQIVCRLLNPFRRIRDEHGERRYPILDTLKPELAVVMVLLLHMNPAMALRRVSEALGPFAADLLQNIGRELMAVGPTSTPTPGAFRLRISRAILGALSPRERRAGRALLRILRGRLLSDYRHVPPGGLGIGTSAWQWFLRAFTEFGWNADGFFDLDAPDATFRSAGPRIAEAEGSVYATGHTHAARRIHMDHGRLYINTGTWQNLIDPPPADSQARTAWVRALQAGQLPPVRRLTAAGVTPHTANLWIWDDASGSPTPLAPVAPQG